MNYSGYNPQQQQPQQQQHSYEYDPSSSQIQIQQPYEYDQSYAAAAYQQQPYYPYNQQYAYYPDLSQFQQPHHLHYQSEQPSPLHPPGVNPTEPLQLGGGPINHLPIGSSQYRGRGGRSFKRGGRGGASYHGRGRGVGSGRHFRSHSAAPAAAGASFVDRSSLPVSEQTLPKPGRTAPVQPRMVYCEICKVECNTPEIMEQHKNGKKHKKNVTVHEKMQRYNAITGQPNEQVPTPQLNPTDQPMNVQESEEKNSPPKNVNSEITADNQKYEIKLQNNVGETSEVPPEMPEGVIMENTAARGRGLKRKGRGGKGRKHQRTADGSKLVQVSKPEQAIVFTCELCNVKCESQVVYQSHVTGKKHLKRAHGHQAPSGVGNETSSGVGHQALPAAVGLQTIYPPDINALANAINAQVQQGDNDPQVLLAQLLVNVLSQAQGSSTAPLNGPLAAQTPTLTPVAGSSYQPLLAQTQASEITEHVGMGILAEGSRSEMLSVPLESNNAHEGSSVSTQIEGSSVSTQIEGSSVSTLIDGGSSETK